MSAAGSYRWLVPYDSEKLRRWPDVEAPDLFASDAADRLILDESAATRASISPAELLVIGDTYGALTLGAVDEGEPESLVRVHQDTLTGERALLANAETAGLSGTFSHHDLTPDLVTGARVALVRLPRSLDELDDIAALIAASAAEDVTVFAGGRIKHMTTTMNEVLRRHFGRVDISHARQKSRVLIAREPIRGAGPVLREATHDGIVIRAAGGAFAGTSIDIGTRFLIANLPSEIAGDDALVDFACGTGVVATVLAQAHPGRAVYASDQSAAAVTSAQATALANGVEGQITVVRDDMLGALPDASVGFIALNPPFHSGAAVTDAIAPRMFADAARVLRPGGELWTVWNSALQYRPALERLVGPTRQVARNGKFTVTASTRH